jgi:chemotaxis protein MotB
MLFRLLPCLWVTACVTTATHEQRVKQLDALRLRQAEEAARREAEVQKKLASSEAQAAELGRQLEQGRVATVELTTQRDAVRQQLDEQTALVAELKKRLEKLGQNVDRLISEKGALAQGLDDTRSRLEELRKQREAVEARLATFRKLVARFQSMIDAGQLSVVVRNGRMLLSLPDAVLFDSGRIDLKAGGAGALSKVAEVLSSLPERNFLVAGHTDDVPIRTPRFPSNWDLSTARAVQVVNYLVKQGMKPQALAAAGYGEFDPLVANDTPEHRAQNRRIEIVLQPNLAELPTLEGVGARP